ncbi:PAS domain-containing protein [Pseudomonas sp. CFBP 13711]|uniref:PAS domain-containing protein n=1 Tax=Pseudomonas sp. CFBP 13711 TaxID=2775310 RepID=UPI00406C16F4
MRLLEAGNALGPLKLLFVEDSSNDIELTLLRLDAGGLSIDPIVAHDYQSACNALRHNQFDVILCDYSLPGLPGTEVLDFAKKAAPQTPFIFLSGMLGEQQAIETIRQGATDYVLKQNLQLVPRAITRAVQEVRERIKRQAAEKALLEVEARARLAIKAAEMGVWELNTSTGEIIWDDRARALYGVTAHTVLALDQVIAMYHPDDRQMLHDRVAQALQVETSFHSEYRLLLPDGQVRWIASDGRSSFENGVCVRFSGVLQDVTVRKNATRDLERLTEKLGESVEQRTRERDRIWEVSREMLAVLHFDLSPATFNPAWETSLGWSKEHLQGFKLLELVHPEDLQATVEEAQRVSTGHVSTRFENRMRHANGTYRWLSWTIVPDNGLMYAAVRDITEERAVIEELATTNEKLLEQIAHRERVEATLQQMQRLEAVGQLTAGVAHDFNNLLTIILTSALFAKREVQKGKFDRILTRLDHISTAGEKGAKLTHQLLSFSRKQRLETRQIDLNATIDGMKGLIEKAVGASVHLALKLAVDLWPAAADSVQTEMVVLNLAINARDAMMSGGTISLSTRNETVDHQPAAPDDMEAGDYVVVSVADTGTGMSSETLKRAFEPFFTTKAVGQGSGLGLAQVFGFAKQSGGGVKIKSQEGSGTSVEVYLPRVEVAAAPSSKVMESHAEEVEYKPANILLVDDDRAVREVTAALIESLGHSVL